LTGHIEKCEEKNEINNKNDRALNAFKLAKRVGDYFLDTAKCGRNVIET
jgi:hypothetical protein